jgi:hypothetical protein
MIAALWEFVGLLLFALGVLLTRSGRAARTRLITPRRPPPQPSRPAGEEIIGWLIAGPGGALAAFNLWKALAGG